MANRIIGLKNIHLAPITVNAGGVETYGTPIKVVGAKTMKTKNNFTEAQFYSDDVMDYYSSMLSSLDVEMELAYLMPEIEAQITGKTYDETTGALFSGTNDKSGRFALLYEMETLQQPIRRCIYDVTMNKDESSAQTKTDKVDEQLIKLTGKAKPNADGLFDLVLDKNVSAVTANVWDRFFTEVITPKNINPASAPSK